MLCTNFPKTNLQKNFSLESSNKNLVDVGYRHSSHYLRLPVIDLFISTYLYDLQKSIREGLKK